MRHFLFVVFIFLGIACKGQISETDSHLHKWGLMAGHGAHELTKVQYTYLVSLFHLQYYLQLHQHRSWSFELLFQPQYNTARYKFYNNDTSFLSGFEYGLNIGALARKYLNNDRLSIYAFISSGPHYAKGLPRRQSAGFIFSDNLFAGFTVKLGMNLFADLRVGVRHLSNAGIKEPNAGIKNTIICAGLMFLP